MYLKDKLDTFVKEFNSNTFFNIGAFIRLLLDKRNGDIDNADDSGINHGLEGQDVKTHSQLKDVMINILVDIAEIEFIKTLFFLPPPHKIISFGLVLKKSREFTIVTEVNSDKVATESSMLKLLNELKLKSLTSKDFGGRES